MPSYPIAFPADSAVLRLERTSSSPYIYTLHFLGAETPDNRLTHRFLGAILDALKHVEKEWDGLDDGQRGGAALITTGQTEEKSKFYSNGCVCTSGHACSHADQSLPSPASLDFENATKDPDFFDTHLNRVYEALLTFPIPTIASIGGHCL